MAKPTKQEAWSGELWLALALILWRLAACSPAHLWKDWILIVSAFWIYTRYKSGSPAWPVAAVTVTAYLLGIYLLGQLPHAIAVLGIGV